jgi:hypothetical protein
MLENSTLKYIARTAKAALAGILMLVAACSPLNPRDETAAPFTLEPGLFDPSKPDDLGLTQAPDVETFTVYRGATEQDNQYNHGAVVIAFKNQLYTQWQSSLRDEDGPDTEVRYAVSNGGNQWSDPIVLASPRANAVITNGGWWTDGETLVAYLNIWPKDLEPRGGHVEYVTTTDGIHWSTPERVTTATGEPLEGIIEQDLRWLDETRILTSVHEQPGLITKPYYTDDPLAVTGWTRGEMTNLDHPPEITRELEPSWFTRRDGSVVMTFRDQGSSFRVLASVSTNRGETWSLPAVTDLIDSRAKQSAGNLPDGTAFIVNNPSGSRTRIPLTLITSADGYHFDKAYLVRAGGGDLQPMLYDGLYKRVGYSYPKSYVFGDYIYVAYATNKEQIEITRVPVSAIGHR